MTDLILKIDLVYSMRMLLSNGYDIEMVNKQIKIKN